ncbi:MAG: hypothetical protein RJP95_02855 [Pirellulales bacterium]
MPGSGNCARCGTSLTLAAATIDVHPPRAGKLVRTAPSLLGVRRAWNRFFPSVQSALASVWGGSENAIARWPTFLECIVPGLGQMRRGDRAQGWLFFGTFALLLSLGILLMGTTAGSLLLGLAFAAHVTALRDATAGSFALLGDRLKHALLVAIGLFMLLYLPAGWAITRVGTPFRLTQGLPPFNQGDVLWYSNVAKATAGDLVLYEVPSVSLAGNRNDGYPARIVVAGQRINRVVAGPGQVVQWNEGQLLVDGSASRYQPASARLLQMEDALTVPRGRFFILPDNLLPNAVAISPEQLLTVSLVAEERVLGPVFLRSYPLNHFTVIR